MKARVQLREWDDYLFGPEVKGKGQAVTARRLPPSRRARPSREATAISLFLATVRRDPEVMLKITGGGKTIQQIKAHLDYISRNGQVELEDHRGESIYDRDGVAGVRDEWQSVGPRIGKRGARREAFNLVFSMPPGTPPQAVKDAVRSFAASEFADHQYVFAEHTDEAHPHVHLAVKAASLSAGRLNPRKADLQRWRQDFAQELRERGVRANATPRRARGVVRRPEKQAVLHATSRGQSWVSDSRLKALDDARVGQPRNESKFDPSVLREQRSKLVQMYAKIARRLSLGGPEEKAAALAVVQFVKSMPAPITAHEAALNVQRDARALDQVERKEPASGGVSIERRQIDRGRDR